LFSTVKPQQRAIQRVPEVPAGAGVLWDVQRRLLPHETTRLEVKDRGWTTTIIGSRCLHDTTTHTEVVIPGPFVLLATTTGKATQTRPHFLFHRLYLDVIMAVLDATSGR